MRVLYIADEGNVGGAAHSFVEVMLNMKRLGVEPVVCNSVPNDLNDFLNQEGIENYSIGHKPVLIPFSFKFPKAPLAWLMKSYIYRKARKKALDNVKKCIDMAQIDLIHTNSARNDLGCYLSKQYKKSHVVHFREFADLDFNCTLLNPSFNMMMNRYCERFITISNAVQRHWIKKGLDANKMKTVYNGIHWQDISESTDESKYSETLRLVITGGVFPTKGQHLAVDAMCMMPKELKHRFTLDVIGWSGVGYVEEMKKVAARNNIADQIHFLGNRNDVPKLLKNYQVGLMCSRAEGFGRATAEYMHARLGVIASDSGANPELIEDGETGLLFKSDDAGALCKCLERYYYNRELLIKCSNRAHTKAHLKYTDTLNAENIYKIYQEIIG